MWTLEIRYNVCQGYGNEGVKERGGESQRTLEDAARQTRATQQPWPVRGLTG